MGFVQCSTTELHAMHVLDAYIILIHTASVAQCNPSCGVNGRCTSSNTCECNEGWTGIDCLEGNACLHGYIPDPFHYYIYMM